MNTLFFSKIYKPISKKNDSFIEVNGCQAQAHWSRQPMESRSAGQHAASGMEFALTGTTHGKELVNSSGWTDSETECKSDREILRQLALENFATRVESGLKSLWKVLRDSSPGVNRADELVAERD